MSQLLSEIRSIISEPYEIKVQTESGLGHAVLQGVKKATGDVIVVLDADGSHNPKYLPRMTALLCKYDIVLGSRYVIGGGSEDYAVRLLLSRLFCELSKLLFNLKVNDNMSGYIVAKKTVFDELTLKPVGYKFGLELLVKGKGKFSVFEYPVNFEKRKMGYSKTGFLQGIRTLASIFRLRLTTLVSS